MNIIKKSFLLFLTFNFAIRSVEQAGQVVRLGAVEPSQRTWKLSSLANGNFFNKFPEARTYALIGIPTAFILTCAYLERLRNSDIKQIYSLSKDWKGNKQVEILKSNNYTEVKKSFRLVLYKPEQTAHSIYMEALDPKTAAELKTTIEIINNAKGSNPKVQVFIIDPDPSKSKVLDPGSISTNASTLDILIKQILAEMTELTACIKKIPNHEQIEKVLLNLCKRINQSVDHKDNLSMLTSDQMKGVFDELRNRNSKGIPLLNRIFNYNGLFKSLSEFWYALDNASINVYIELMTLYTKAVALHKNVSKYRSFLGNRDNDFRGFPMSFGDGNRGVVI